MHHYLVLGGFLDYKTSDLHMCLSREFEKEKEQKNIERIISLEPENSIAKIEVDPAYPYSTTKASGITSVLELPVPIYEWLSGIQFGERYWDITLSFQTQLHLILRIKKIPYLKYLDVQ